MPVATTPEPSNGRPYILDVSRLLWRLGRNRLPTGIDRVCQAYLDGLGNRSLAMVQWRRLRFVMGACDSDRLFRLLQSGLGGRNKRKLWGILATALARRVSGGPPLAGRIVLNVGHTGLNAPGLVEWLRKKRVKPVYLIHDLIPITHPQYCRVGEAERHAQRMRQALLSASGIIANSRATQAELANFATGAGLAMPPVLVAHLGIEPLPANAAATPHGRPYFLCIGTIEGRKNHALLLHVWNSLRERLGGAAPDLVLIGQRGWMADDVFAALDGPPHAFGQVLELAQCDDEELAQRITHARAVLMPSHVEGYGLPVLEAMALGAPVIASNLPVYREIAGDVPLLLDPTDVAGWIEAIAAYTTDSDSRDRQIRTMAGYKPPRWADHIAAVERWLSASCRA